MRAEFYRSEGRPLVCSEGRPLGAGGVAHSYGGALCVRSQLVSGQTIK
jgi:hypothetical protein